MSKPVKTIVKLQAKGGVATPAPPLGPALGQHGLNIGDFCSRFNDATSDRKGEIVPIVLTIYEDNSFDFVLKKSPAAELLKQAAKVKKGAGDPLRDKVGKITKADVARIVEEKMEDLNANDTEAAAKIVSGTARSMGIEVV